MLITKLLQNHTFSGFLIVILFAMMTTLITIPDSNLEQRVIDLENRVDTLEEAVLDKSTSEKAGELEVSSDKALSITNWRQLETGMSYDDVRKLLGEPDEINGGNIASWHYPNNGRVMFFLGDLDSWYEPEL